MVSESKLRIKKSQGFEAWFFVIVVLLGFTLFILVLNKAWTEIKTPLNTGLESSMAGKDYSNANFTKVLNKTGSSTQFFDKLLPFLIIGLFSFVLIMAGAIIRHPIMIFVGIIILGVVILLAVVYSNLYNSISDNNSFSDIKAELPIQDKFMHYLPIIVFLMAIGIGTAILWSRGGAGGQL